MRNIKIGEKGGQINLSQSLPQEEVDLGFLGFPTIEIRSDGRYEILASTSSPDHLISVYSEAGDNIFVWDYSTAAACRYIMIRLLSGTYLNALVSTHTRNGN